jgi:hypothetical protein
MQLQNKQASRPLHVHTTMQPLSKITVCTNVLASIPTCEINKKKSGIGHQIFKYYSEQKGEEQLFTHPRDGEI